MGAMTDVSHVVDLEADGFVTRFDLAGAGGWSLAERDRVEKEGRLGTTTALPPPPRTSSDATSLSRL
jgi:hypothetical protein